MNCKLILLLGLVAAVPAHAESYIPYQHGKLVLLAIPGCGGAKDPQNRMYGLWEKKDGGKELFCWSYNETISIYYSDGKAENYLPSEVRREEEPNSESSPRVTPEISMNSTRTDLLNFVRAYIALCSI